MHKVYAWVSDDLLPIFVINITSSGHLKYETCCLLYHSSNTPGVVNYATAAGAAYLKEHPGEPVRGV